MTPTEQCNRDVQDIINGAGTGLHAAILAYGRACAVEAWQLGRASASAVPEKRPLEILPPPPPEMHFYRRVLDAAPSWHSDPPEVLR